MDWLIQSGTMTRRFNAAMAALEQAKSALQMTCRMLMAYPRKSLIPASV
jgi:hypothetical protein